LVDFGVQRQLSTSAGKETAIGHFEDFLAYSDFRTIKFDELEAREITKELFGKFADYLSNEDIVQSIKSPDVAIQYLSGVRSRIELKFGVVVGQHKKGSWYYGIKANVRSNGKNFQYVDCSSV
jgi:hypothetical protein